MISKFFTKVEEVLGPYYTTISYIVRVFIVVIVIVGSCDLISSPSTINVLLGLCGLGIVGTYIIMFVVNKVKNELKKVEGEKKDDEKVE